MPSLLIGERALREFFHVTSEPLLWAAVSGLEAC